MLLLRCWPSWGRAEQEGLLVQLQEGLWRTERERRISWSRGTPEQGKAELQTLTEPDWIPLHIQSSKHGRAEGYRLTRRSATSPTRHVTPSPAHVVFSTLPACGDPRRSAQDTTSAAPAAAAEAAYCCGRYQWAEDQTIVHQGCTISQGAENMGQQPPFEKLPDDLLHRIHSLLQVKDAACAACVSRAFLRSWRCYSKLVLNCHAVGLTDIKYECEERNMDLVYKVDKILKNHYDKGVKVETLCLNIMPCNNIKASYLDRWLRRTVKSGIKELTLMMPICMKTSYNFPCSVLSDEGAASSIQSLHLLFCDFHPTSTLGCLRRLKILILSLVHTTEEGLEHLLSKSSTLEELRILTCSGITCLKIPCTMQHLKILYVERCKMLRVVEIDAPNLRSFHYDSALQEISVRNCSQLKHVNLSYSYPFGVFLCARTSLPSIARNVESLILDGCSENADTPMLQSKLPHLKNLEVRLSPGYPPSNYDIFFLVSFLDAAPALQSFTLHVNPYAMARCPVVGDDDECPRPKVDFWHNHLRQVTITGFCSAKSLVELTVHILESSHSLERLTLDTTRGYDRRIYGTIDKCPNSRKIGRCWPMSKEDVEEAHRGVKTAGRHITVRVPLAVQFDVMEPCSRCHTGNQ